MESRDLDGPAVDRGARFGREAAADDDDARVLRAVTGADDGGGLDRGVAVDHDDAARDGSADDGVAVDHDNALSRLALSQRVVLEAHDGVAVTGGRRGGGERRHD